MPMKKIRIALVDDDETFISSYKTCFENTGDLEITAVFHNAEQAKASTTLFNTDIVITDLQMETTDAGIRLAQWMKQRGYPGQIIILTNYVSQIMLMEALVLGINGYLEKSYSPADVAQAIRTIMRGGAVISPKALRGLIEGIKPVIKMTPTIAGFSQVDQAIIKHLLMGQTLRQIANSTGISIATVNRHIRDIRKELGAKNNREVVIKLTTPPAQINTSE